MVAAPSPLARGPQWQLDDTTITRLAVEMAREMYTIPEILDRFSIDAEIFRTRVRPHPSFERAYLEARAIWTSSSNARERVQLKAGTLFEDWMAEADQLFHDKSQPLSAKVEMLKTLGKVAGFDHSDKAPTVAPGDRVVVEINLGAAGKVPQSTFEGTTITIDKVAPVIDLNAAPEPLPEWNTLPPGIEPPAPAVYVVDPSPPPPLLAPLPVPAEVTPVAKPKLVPYIPAAE